LPNRLILAILAMFGASGAAGAQALLDEVNTIGTAATGVPIVQSFSISAAGTYQVTLTDLGAALSAPLSPAPLATTPPVELAVTQGSTVVATVSGTTNGVARLSFAATAGTYVLRVTGAPGPNPGSGPIGLQVTGGPSSTTVFSYTGALALPSSSLAPTEVVLNTSFTVPASGNYTLALTDLQLPTALGTLTLALVEPSCSSNGVATLCAVLTSSNGAAATTSLTLDPTKTYQVFAVGQVATGVAGGLYSVAVTAAGGGSPAFYQAVPLGAVQALGSATLTASTQTLALTDLGYPAALAQLAAVVIQNGAAVAAQTGAGSQTFTPAAGSYQIYALAAPASSGAGSFGLTLGPSGSPVFSTVQVAANGSATQRSFLVSGNVTSPGSYEFRLADFQIPGALTSVGAALVQGNALVGTPSTAAGSVSATLANGAVYAIVIAKSTSSGGLVGVDLVPAAGGTPVFAATQGVGGVFSETTVPITATGSYTVNVEDLAFPAAFANLYVVVTQGTQSIGSIFGGGSFNFDAATAGNYIVSFLAEPSTTAEAGTYSIDITPTPPAPTVTLTSSVPQVANGGTVTLTWSTQNATSCVASGGWSGTLATSGTQTSSAITAATTFTLTCSGTGGSTAESVTVALAPRSGGGGALDGLLLLVLSVAVIVALRRQWRGPVMW